MVQIPGMGMGITGHIPVLDEIPESNRLTFDKVTCIHGL